MNKALKIGIPVVAVAGIATAITVPIVLNKKKDTLPFIDDSKLVWPGLSIKDLIDGIKKEEAINGSVLTSIQKAASFLLYDEEQKGSLKLQAMDFKYNIFKLDKEKVELDAKTQTKSVTDRLAQIVKDKKKINDKLTKIESTTGLTSGDYNAANFNSEYPKVLMTQSIIKDRQTNILNDIKDSFIDQFPKYEEGAAAWVKERASKYNGATSDEEALTMLVYGIISPAAFADKKYSINSSYTKEMKEATVTPLGTDYIYPFLQKATTKAVNPLKTDKVYFVSTNSKNPTKIYVELEDASHNPTDAVDTMTGAGLIQMSHALIPAAQDKINPELNWAISKEALIGAKDKGYGLLSSYTPKGLKSEHLFNRLSTLYSDPTNPTQNDKDDFFISRSLGQPSAGKYGSLGVKTKLESIEKMDNGFKIGAIEAFKNEAVALSNDEKDVTKPESAKYVIKHIVDGLNSWVTDTNNVPAGTSISKAINSLTKEEITKQFGSIFRDAFGGKPKFLYRISKTSYITTSVYGIHFVKYKNYTNSSVLLTQMKADLDKAAKEQDTSKMEINYNDLFAKLSTSSEIVKSIIEDPSSDLYTKLKEGYGKSAAEKDADTTLMRDELDSTNTKKPFDSADPNDENTVIADIKKSLADNKNSKAVQKINASLGAEISTYIDDKYDNELIDRSLLTSTTVTAEQIYQDALVSVGM